MHGTKLDTRSTWWAKLLRRLSGDWWRLEEKGDVWGVWHPWKRHVWENYRFDKHDALKEQERRNSGLDYGICPKCGTTYASHTSGRFGGVDCPEYPKYDSYEPH
jgi:hypothetical protein